MEELVQTLIQFQVSIKILHWQTHSYARHIATDTLYTSLSANIDKFVEILQGKYGRVKFHKKAYIRLVNFDDKTSSTSLIKVIQHWLEEALPKMISTNDTDLLNIRDEMLASINQTSYLFTLG